MASSRTPGAASRGKVAGVERSVDIRDLARDELARVCEIDRTERIDVLSPIHFVEANMPAPVVVASTEFTRKLCGSDHALPPS